ncbi:MULTISPECIES: tyrosine-type recombinase/integrase [Methylomonas]|uniref:Integrase n=2 Tax=Methylomonas TaxID=416 RepID=A0A140E6V0_9GAMM|nr:MULTISPECIES: site-specific integrase [Methylomonas]AMK79124.1 integrase [Methylomonas denitrificans]OAH99634.1 integrase [Methylomonas methanica]TCV78196.1 site-specific recombinase XerD [Methylomonas methanica]
MSNLTLSDDDLAYQNLSLLDGRDGSNRAQGHRQIAADTDIEAVRLWLAEYHDSPHTLRSYRKEAVRLLIWATEYLGKPMSSMTREDFLTYEAFLASPTSDWNDPRRPRRGSDRRLFDGPLSPQSIRQTMGILSGLFGYLVAAGYLAGNPLVLRRRRSKSKVGRLVTVERYLDQALWQSVLEFIETMPKQIRREIQHYERARWLFRLLYGASLRVSEAAQAKSGDLLLRRGNWWLKVIGKGDAEGSVPISDELMADLARYRLFNGLSAMPSVEENTPLVLSVGGRKDRSLTSTAIYLIVKEVFRRAAKAIEETDPAGAATLLQASTHWLRHTSATHQADAGNDIRYIQKNLRHASIETTAIYLHAEDDRRHAATIAKCRHE